MALMNGNLFGLISRESYVECLSSLDQSHWRQFFKRERERSDEGNLKASHWSCGCLNTYHPRFECPSMSESERAEHKARSVGCSTAGDSLYEECLATQGDPITPELDVANRTITVLREGIDKANAEIMRLRDDLARRPAAFVEPESDKPNPFRDFTTDRRRMGPL